MTDGVHDVTEATLRNMPLPTHREGDDKDARGCVLVIAGSTEVPGGALLAGIGALRAGAGKLQIATCKSVAAGLALAIPEARVTGFAETNRGDIHPDAAVCLADRSSRCDAVLVGPGMLDDQTAACLTAGLLRRCQARPVPFVLDAAALKGLLEGALLGQGGALAGRVIITPHAGEMAGLLGLSREDVLADRLGAARQAAAMFQVVVAMKGACTFIVTPDGTAWSCDRGNVGLATSGSGDTLAGIVAGLLARGATPLAATLWGVFLHGQAGERLAQRKGPLGFLARELLAEIPAILADHTT